MVADEHEPLSRIREYDEESEVGIYGSTVEQSIYTLRRAYSYSYSCANS